MVFDLGSPDSSRSSSFSTSEAALPTCQPCNYPDGCLRALVSRPVVTGMENRGEILRIINKASKICKGAFGEVHLGMERLKPYNRGEISSIINKAPKIGKGAFGEVYRCSLDDHTTVAVKVLSKSSWQGRKEFLAEVR